MTRNTFLLLSLFFALCLDASAKTVGEYLKAMPDSLCPVAHAIVPDAETDRYLHISLSRVSEMEMRTLVAENGDTLVCVVQTFKAPLAESDVRIYDAGWCECQHLQFCLADIIGAEEVPSVRSLFDPLLIAAHLDAENDDLELTVSDSNLSEEEKKEIKRLKLQTSLKWSGKTFK